MKSYTDLKQSKKLSEILPLESADMIYRSIIMDIDSMSNSGFLNIPDCDPFSEFKDNNIKPLPCWSLAALLNILPKLHGLKPILDLEENSIQYSGTDIYEVASNPVDACVAAIEKLHELKFL